MTTVNTIINVVSDPNVSLLSVKFCVSPCSRSQKMKILQSNRSGRASKLHINRQTSISSQQVLSILQSAARQLPSESRPKGTTCFKSTPISQTVSKRKAGTPIKRQRKCKRHRIEFGQNLEEACAIEFRELSGTLTNVLNTKGHLADFMDLVRGLCDGSMPIENISFLLCLERARYSRLETTTGMNYSNKTIQFWKVVYRKEKP